MNKMKNTKLIFAVCYLVMYLPYLVVGLDCTTCSWSLTGAQNQLSKDCINGDGPQFECPYLSNQNPYCQTTVSLRDGVTTSINQMCTIHQSGTAQLDSKCETTHTILSDSNVATTTCKYGCSTNECNKNPIDFIKLCPYSCGPNGQCDYLKGTCECRDGYTSANCTVGEAPPVQNFRSCVQCDDDVEECGEPTICESPSNQYCSSTQTFVYSLDGKLINSVISKGCTSDYVASDECFISSRTDNQYTSDIEYTCISTCDSDGCNTNTPNGFLEANEAKTQPLKCVVCSYNSDDGFDSCSTQERRTTCPSSSRYCSSTVTYYISDKLDVNQADGLAQPDYMLKSVNRGCAVDAVVRQCTSKQVQSGSLKEVTCQETCNVDGCNIGWPARPKCSTCSDCLENPDTPAPCDLPYMEYCVIRDQNRAIGLTSSVKGYPQRAVIRGCRYRSIGNGCSSPSYGVGVIETCNTTCTTDGCNLGEFGNGASINKFNVMQLVVFVLVSTTLL